MERVLARCALFLSLGIASRVRADDIAVRCNDDALSAAAATLLSNGADIEPSAVRRAAQESGSTAPAVYAHRGAPTAAWFAELSERIGAPLSCGVATTESRVLVLAAPALAHVTRRGAHFHVALGAGMSNATLYVQDEHGSVHAFAVENGAAAAPDIEIEGWQVVATGSRGPRPVAEWHGQLALGASSLPIPLALEALRETRGAPRLRAHRLLSRVASTHAETVCRAGHAEHLPRRGDDPEARLLAVGLRARSVGEVIARAPSEGEAFAALEESPSHRAALLDPRFTDVGIGIARSGTMTCLVAVLAAWPRWAPPARPREE